VSEGVITAVGDLEACRAAAPGADVIDLGDSVLMPGFVEPHSHLVPGGLATQRPAYWIAPYVGYPHATDVDACMRAAHAAEPPGRWLLFQGWDKLLHGADGPDAAQLDAIFGERPVVVWDNSGHVIYFNTAVMDHLGWLDNPPADPQAGSYGRTAAGHLDGRAYETGALLPILTAALPLVAEHPLASVAQFYAMFARAGITTANDMGFATHDLPAYEALAGLPSLPLRVTYYHMSTEDDCELHHEITAPDALLRKVGIKLWADGSPWVGNVALSFPYLDSETVRRAGITLDTGGLAAMNYDRAALDAVIDAHAASGWQMAIHVNGDLAADVVLDAYQAGLERFGLLGTDHRWRMEHCGAMTAPQFQRASALGVEVSIAMFQFTYYGDLLDGEMFESRYGANWNAAGDAVAAGLQPSFHNDGQVSPANPLLNAQAAVTRTTPSGTVHGLHQAIDLDTALRAITINGARQLRRDHEVGSIEVGKFADLVELGDDPFEVPPTQISSIEIRSTWLGGSMCDLDRFLDAAGSTDPEHHRHHAHAGSRRCC
jgi:predicted amidohydrolase YtcJ